MRGGDERTERLLSYVSCEAWVPAGHPLQPARMVESVRRAFQKTSDRLPPVAAGRQTRILKASEQDAEKYRQLWAKILAGDVDKAKALDERGDSRLLHESRFVVPISGDEDGIAWIVTICTGFSGPMPDMATPNDERVLAQSLRDSEEARRALSAQLLSILEKERKRMAGELHDHIGQILTSIKLRTESAISSIKSGQFGNGEKVLRSIVPMVQETLDEVRRISMDLRPSILDDLGIVATIGWFCRNFTATCADLRIELDLHVDEREVPESLKIVIYRVLQEAMTNIGKHAHADFVRVRLSRPVHDFELVIEDNGCGFEVAEVMARGPGQRGVGLASMRERVEVIGGRLSIQSGRQIGTVIQAILPSDGPAEGRASASRYA